MARKWEQSGRKTSKYLEAAWTLQHRADGFARDIVAADQPGAIPDAEFMGSRGKQAYGLITEFTSLFRPLQEFLGCGVAGIFRGGWSRLISSTPHNVLLNFRIARAIH